MTSRAMKLRRGIIVYALGSVLSIVFAYMFAIHTLQQSSKTMCAILLFVVSLVFAILSMLNEPGFIFACLSLVLPFLIVFFIGGTITVLVCVQGLNAVSLYLLLPFLSSIVCLAASITLIAATKKCKGVAN
jgi:hypothetical protein